MEAGPGTTPTQGEGVDHGTRWIALAVAGGILLVVAAVAFVVVADRNRPRPTKDATTVEAASAFPMTSGPTTARAPTTTPRPSTAPVTTATPAGPSTTRARASAVWQAWTAPDGTFSISFPGKPQVNPVSDGRIGGKMLNAASYTGSDAEYAVTWDDAAPIDARGSLDRAMDQLSGNLHIEYRTNDPFRGALAARVTGYLIGSNQPATAMYIVVGNRLYSLIAHGLTPSSFDFDTFLASFTGA